MTKEPFHNLDQEGVAQTNRQGLLNNLWPQSKSGQVDVTFDGGTTDGIGDIDGANSPYTLASVTGIVEVVIVAIGTTDLVSAGDGLVEVGTGGDTAALIAQTAATDVDAFNIWHDASPDASVELSSVVTRKIVSSAVVLTTSSANITAGAISFMIFWNPISKDGAVVITS